MKLKKLLSIILAAAILLTTVQISFAFLLSAESDVVYYVAANGSDTTGNGSEPAPFATINKAQEVVHAAEGTNPVNATIKVKGEADFDGGVEHDGMITIEGADATSALALKSNQTVGLNRFTVIKGDTTLKNIGFNTNESSSRIVTDGHKFVFNVKSSAVQPTIYVGTMDENSTTKVEDVTVNNWPGSSTDGLELAIRGAVTASKRVSAGVNLTVNGGYLKGIEFARTKYSGDVNLVYNKFSPTTDFAVSLGNNVTFGGALQIIANNGITTDVAGELSEATATDGVWIIKSGVGGQVTPTAVAGKFNVTFDTGYISAKAVNKETSAEVPVENGEVTLDAGTYDIIFQKQAQGGSVTEKTYYVDTENGLDTNNGNQGAPFKTLDKAMETAVNTEYTTGGAVNATIYVKGNNINFNGGISHLGTFIIKGYGDEAPVVNLGTETLTDSSGAQITGTLLKGHTTFDGVAFAKNSDNTEKHIISGGYKLVLKNITCYELNKYNYHIGYGDSTATDTKDVGEFANIGANGETNIILGAVSSTNKTSQGLDLNLNGGKISGITFLNGTEYTGDVNINVSNITSTDKATFVNNGATFGGAFQFIVNKASKVHLAESALSNIQAVTATGGKWAIYSDNTGGSISATETPGTFKVGGSYYAKATDVTNPETVYYSDDDKKLVLPQGSYDVTYVPELPSAGPIIPAPETVEKEYYLDTVNGSDDNDGLTASTPFKTLAKAQATAATFETTDNIVNVTVNLKGELTIETQAHKGMLTINGLDDTAITGFPSNHVLNGPLTLNNIISKLNGNHPTTDGHEFILNSKNENDTNNIYYNVGNSTGSDSSYSNEKVTIVENKRSMNRPANYYIGALGSRTVIGSVDFLHQSGHMRWIDFKTDTTYKGNVNITIDSFTQRTNDESQYYAEKKSGNPVFEKAFQVIYNNGSANSIKTAKVFETNAITAAGGKWIIYAESGALLRTTKLAGVFEVIGVDTVATAVNRDDPSKIYTSNEQNLIHIEEPGVYTVTFDGPDLVIPDEPEPTNIIEKTFYANATTGNDDDNDGLTPDTAVRTVNKAQALAAAFEDVATDTAVNATIYLAGGEFEFDGGVAHRGMFTLVGDGTADTTLVVKYTSHGGIYGSTLKGPTTFKDINVTDSANNEHILTNGHKLVLDINQPDSQKKNIFVGNTDDTGSLKNEHVTVNNITGAYSLASSYQFGSFGAPEGTGNVSLVHNNGCLYSFQFAKDGLFKGTVNITVNGYTTRKDSAGAPRVLVRENVRFLQAVQLIFNNETDAQFVENQLTNATAKRGIWIMYGDNGGTLEVTDTYGTFKATSDKTCYAVNKETYKIYKAENGVLTVPAGEYDVSYRDKEPDVELPYPDANEELNDTEGTIKEYYVYVAPESEGGSNRNGDGSQEKPYRTIDKAMYHIASIPKETGVIKKGIIMLSGEAEFDGGEPHVNMITIRAVNSTAKINAISNGNYNQVNAVTTLLGPVTFDGLIIPRKNHFITSNGHEIVITNCSEDGKTNSGKDSYFYMSQVDSPANNTKGETITVNGWSGSSWGGLNLSIGPVGNKPDKSIGKVNVVVNSGKFKSLRLRSGIYTDDVNFTWNGGTYTNDGPYSAYLMDKEAGGIYTFKGAFQFVVNNGCGEIPTTQSQSTKVNADGTPKYEDKPNEQLFVGVTAEKGEWFMYGEKGGRLEITDTAGTYNVSAGTIATAVNRSTKKSYTSSNGTLTVPEGFYDVTYERDIANSLFIDAMPLESETLGQNVHLENGKTYKFSFDYRNIENGLDKNVDVAVYSKHGTGKNVLYSSALSGDKKIKLVSEATGTYHRVYEFTFNGTTGDYGVGFVINGSTIMRIYNPELVVSTNVTENLYKNALIKKNLANWKISATSADENAKEHSYTQGNAFVTIKLGDYYYSDYKKIPSNAKALHIKSDGEMSIGTNVDLKGGKTYRLEISHKGVNTDFYFNSFVIVKTAAYGTHSTTETFRTKYNNINPTLPRVYKDDEFSTVVFEFTADYDSTYGIGVRAHNMEINEYLEKIYEMYIGNIALYDIGDPYVNLISNADFSDNLNGWYVSEHTEVSKDTGHNITSTTDYKMEPSATKYTLSDKDYVELVDSNPNFFKKLKGDEIGPKQMVYIQNGPSYSNFSAYFKEEEKLLPNHTYVLSYALCADYEYKLYVVHDGARKAVFESNLDYVSKEEVKGDGYKYYIYTYEFTLPEKVGTADLSHEIMVGFNMGANHSAWAFDFNMYDKADPRKTNLIPNAEFRQGLDYWIWGWNGMFTPRKIGYGWTTWPAAGSEEESMVYVAPYDFKNLVSYKDDANFNDGEWWNADDVVDMEAQAETGYVSGTIVDDKGNPLKDITVELVGTDPTSVFTAKTDAKGFFEFKDILADIYSVNIISADGNRRETGEYIAITDTAIVTLNIKVAPEEIIVDSSTSAKKSTIKGTLYNAKREPLAGVTVGVARNRTMVTDENGNFEFNNLPAGKYRIFAVNPNGSYYLLRDYELGEGQVVSLRLKYDPNAKDTSDNNDADKNVDSDSGSGFPWWILIVVGAVLILGAGAVIVIVLLKKKKQLTA